MDRDEGLTYGVTARNAATESENRIHDDAVARSYGFGGGLVPGVTLYAYLTHPVVEHYGRAWLERGRISARFRSPVYDGQTVEVHVAHGDARDANGSDSKAPGSDGPGSESNDPEALTLCLTNADGVECVTAEATVSEGPAGVGSAAGVDPTDVPSAGLPEMRPEADETSLAPGTVLGTVWDEGDGQRYELYQALLEGDLPIYQAQGLVHPGRLILSANTILVANVVMGPWVHVGSDVTNLAVVPAGSVVETRARVAERFERKGHKLVVLDVVWMVEDHPVMTARHTAIYQLRT